jgi:hypothetical protein
LRLAALRATRAEPKRRHHIWRLRVFMKVLTGPVQDSNEPVRDKR